MNRNRGIRHFRSCGIHKSYWHDSERFADLFNAVLFDGRSFFRAEDLEDVADSDEESSYPAEQHNHAVDIRGGDACIRILKRSRKYGAAFVLLITTADDAGRRLRVHTAPGSRISVFSLCLCLGEKNWCETDDAKAALMMPAQSSFGTAERRMKPLQVARNNYRFRNDQNRHLFALMRLLADRSLSSAARRDAYLRYCKTHAIAPDTLRIVETVTGRCSENSLTESELPCRTWSVWDKTADRPVVDTPRSDSVFQGKAVYAVL
ncbi:MAG: hypothetical protein IJP92_07690 [Lachnospiraceae bacterium]|nr:hypothetical protein [Lachnospiraceae bacterium]